MRRHLAPREVAVPTEKLLGARSECRATILINSTWPPPAISSNYVVDFRRIECVGRPANDGNLASPAADGASIQWPHGTGKAGTDLGGNAECRCFRVKERENLVALWPTIHLLCHFALSGESDWQPLHPGAEVKTTVGGYSLPRPTSSQSSAKKVADFGFARPWIEDRSPGLILLRAGLKL